MTTKLFEEIVEFHSYDPGKLFNALALSGEVGGLNNIIKKLIYIQNQRQWFDKEERKQLSDNLINDAREEIGDCLFYLTRLAQIFGLTINEVMINQTHKLKVQSEKYGRNFIK